MIARGDFAGAQPVLATLRRDLLQLAGHQRAQVHALLAEATHLAGNPDEARHRVAEGLAALEAAQSAEARAGARLRCELQNRALQLALEAGDALGAYQLALDNLALAKQGELVDQEVLALLQLGQLRLRHGDHRVAETRYRSALALAEESGDQRRQAICLQHLAITAERRCAYREAVLYYQRSVAVLKKLGHRSYLAWVALDLGKLYLDLGDVPRGQAMVELGERLIDPQPPATTRAALELLKGRIARSRCRFDSAEQRMLEALRIAEEAGLSTPAIRCRLELVELSLELGAAGQAARQLKRIGEPQQPSQLMQALLLRGRVALDWGKLGEATTYLSRARDLADSLAAEEGRWKSRYLLALVARRRRATADARRLIVEASEIEHTLRQRVPDELRCAYDSEPLRCELRRDAHRIAVHPDDADEPEHLRRDLPREDESSNRDAVKTSARSETSAVELVGDNPRLARVLAQIERVGPTDTLVLVRGESGTGKELVAEALHRASSRSRRPLVRVNCGALAESLLLSELFGHERGSFTGASQRRLGRFEVADGGTIFLDEIGDISARAQVALLRVLQERVFERVGGTAPISVDVRIICATHRDLRQMVDEGRFREDLYYRLRGVELELPALRQRADDIPLLARHFLTRIRNERGAGPTELDDDALSLLCRYGWPGNVRELQNVVRSAALFCEGTTLAATDLASFPEIAGQPLSATRADTSPPASAYAQLKSQRMSLRQLKRQVERACVEQALIESRGRVNRAAELLRMKRPRLSQLIKELDLSQTAASLRRRSR